MRNPVHLPVDTVERLVFQPREYVRVVGDQIGVDRGDIATVDQPQIRLAWSGTRLGGPNDYAMDLLLGAKKNRMVAYQGGQYTDVALVEAAVGGVQAGLPEAGRADVQGGLRIAAR